MLTATMSPTLRFSRTYAGRYHANGAGHSYLILRDGRRWALRVYSLRNLGGPLHADFHDTMRDAIRVADTFEALGDDYTPSEHGARNRFTEAVCRAYDSSAENCRPRSKRARYNAYRAELAEHSPVRLREIIEEIGDPNDVRGDDELFVKALYVCLRAALPSRLPFRTR
jgi:hypothetical protein